MTDNEFQSEAALPAIIPVWDALNLIAFKELRPRPEMAEVFDQTSRWGSRDLPLVLKALEARASPQPYYVLGVQSLDGESHHVYLDSRVGPRMLRWIRKKARQRESRLVTFQELPGMLRKELSEIEEKSSRLVNALTFLTGRIRCGKLDAWALQGTSRRATDTNAIHAKVDPNVFLNDAVALTSRSTIGADLSHSSAVFNYQGPQYHDVRFRSEDVLKSLRESSTHAVSSAAIPETNPSSPPAVSQRPSGGGAPIQHDWEAFSNEMALWVNLNGLDEMHRHELQAHMVNWTSEQWPEPPHASTIRKKVKRLYEAYKAHAEGVRRG